MSAKRISADIGPEENVEAIDGGPRIYKASGAFNNDGPTLVDKVSMEGNRVRHTEPAERLV